MHKPKPEEPWAYVAHKNGKWAGSAAGNMDRKDLSEFLGEFVLDGYQIETCMSKDAYEKFLGALRPITKG